MGLWLAIKKNRLLSGLGVALAIALVLCLAAGLHFFHGLRTLLSDQLFKATGLHTGAPASDDIVIVTIDDASLAELGLFTTWPRFYHAALVDALDAAGARLIVFDILFSEPADGDAAFAASMAAAGNVILPYAYSQVTYASTAAGRSISLDNPVQPDQALRERALTLGHAIMLPDEDGIVRMVPLFIGEPEDPRASLALAAVAKYLRRPGIADGPITDGALPLAGREIPVDAYGNMLINYADATAGDTPFIEVSYSGVLSGAISPDVFRDRIVLIGVTATGLGDTFWTPLGGIMHGVELHAASMETILAGQFLHTEPLAGTLLVIVLLALVTGVIFMKFRVLWAITAAVGMVALYLVVAIVGFERGIIVDLLFAPLAVAAAGGGVTALQVLSEQAEIREISRTFGRFVSPEVAGRILKAQRQDTFEIRGVSRELTAMYVDARNFMALVESHDPATVFKSLNIYMKAIIASIQRHLGIVNKFTGDGVLAIWNAPVEEENHAALAVQAALTCQRAVRRIRASGAADLPIEFGVGIMTGNTYFGTMGSRDRMEFTVLGDAVNTSSRLCSLAPGNRVWIGGETYELVKDSFIFTSVGEKSLKGRHQPVAVYEVADDIAGDVNDP